MKHRIPLKPETKGEAKKKSITASEQKKPEKRAATNYELEVLELRRQDFGSTEGQPNHRSIETFPKKWIKPNFWTEKKNYEPKLELVTGKKAKVELSKLFPETGISSSAGFFQTFEPQLYFAA